MHVKIPVDVFAPEVGRMLAIALELRVDGMRVASDRVFRQEWAIKIDLKLPEKATGSAQLVTVSARAVPGVREVRGQFVQDLTFVDLSSRSRAAIERFLSGDRSS